VTRVRIKSGWSSFDGSEGELVETFDADGYVLVRLDGDEKPLRFDIDLIEIIDSSAA
jgi:hypothetical protein